MSFALRSKGHQFSMLTYVCAPLLRYELDSLHLSISRVVIMIQGMSWNSDLTERNDLTLEKISWHGTDDLGLSHLDPTLTDILNHPIYIIIITNHHHHHNYHPFLYRPSFCHKSIINILRQMIWTFSHSQTFLPVPFTIWSQALIAFIKFENPFSHGNNSQWAVS